MLRDLRAHRGRVVMTLAAILLGVGFVVATWVVSDSLAKTVGQADSRSVAVSVASGKNRLTEADLAKLRALPGVTGSTPVTFGFTAVVKADGKLRTAYQPQIAGTQWDESGRFAVTSGRAPQRDGEILLLDKVASDAGLPIGSTARLLREDGGSHQATVVGTFSYRTLGIEAVPDVVYAQSAAAAILGPGYDRIELSGDPATVVAAARAAGFAARTGDDLRAEAVAAAEDSAGDARNMLLAFAGIALFVGAFVIANTFTMLVTQRTRQFALLRAVGATRRQVRRAVLAEAAVLGLLGSVAGALLGVGLGALVLNLLAASEDVTVVFAVSPGGIAVGLAVGVAVTVVSAYGAARRGAAVAPVAALRTDAALPRRSLAVRTWLGLGLIAAGGAAVAATAHLELTDPQRAVGMAGAVAAWCGVLLLMPRLVSAVLRPLAAVGAKTSRPFAAVGAGSGTSRAQEPEIRATSVISRKEPVVISRRGPAMRLGLRNALRDPRRTAATAAALMIGVALVTAFATVGATFQDNVRTGVSESVPKGTAVLQPTLPTMPLTPGVVEQARAVPGVEVVGARRYLSVRVTAGGKTFGAVGSGVEKAAIGTALRPRIIAGVGDLDKGVLVTDGQARKHKLAPGDRVTLRFSDGRTAETVISGVYIGSDALAGVVVDAALAPADAPIAAAFASGRDPSVVRAALRTAFADRPDVQVTDRDGLIEAGLRNFALLLGILYALLGTAVVIAVFGVVNTLALSVMERRREIGVLRAVGASRKLIRRTVRLESIVLALTGGAFGIVTGAAVGAVMQHLIFTRPLWEATLPWSTVVVTLAGMLAVGVVAAAWPARRAARADILAAITTE